MTEETKTETDALAVSDAEALEEEEPEFGYNADGTPQAYEVPESVRNAIAFITEFARNEASLESTDDEKVAASRLLMAELGFDPAEGVLQEALNESLRMTADIGVAATLAVVTGDVGELVRHLAGLYGKAFMVGAAAAQGRSPITATALDA